MPAANTAKIFAKLIKAYRATYVASAEAVGRGGGFGDILMRLILGGKTVPPPTSKNLFKNPEDVMRLIRGMSKK